MNSSQVRTTLSDIDIIKDRIVKLKQARAGLRDNPITVSLNGITFDVREYDSRYGSYKSIRGREMVELGVLKYLNGRLDEAEWRLETLQAELKKELS